MKKTVLSLIALCIGLISFSQSDSLKKAPSIGVGIFFKDFETPGIIKSTSLYNAITHKPFVKLYNVVSGASVSYVQGFNDKIDLSAIMSGCFTKYVHKSTFLTPFDNFLWELDAHVNYKFLTDKHILVPYVTAGMGLSLYNGTNLMYNNITGIGFQLKVASGSFVMMQSTYKYGVTNVNMAKDNMNYCISYISPLFHKKTLVKVIPTATVVDVDKDSDGDGIPDSRDKCPTVPGSVKYFGCPIPDKDGDGINDELDKCPNIPGEARYDGCPIPDTDGDGINDELDKCPKVMGLARYNGCPIPDTDGDGLNDEEDKCPTVAGLKENDGCPEIQKKISELAKSVYFNKGTAIVSPNALAPLNDVIDILKKYPSANLSIEGHTDNTGNPITNKKLSQKRADTIKSYLVKNGIEERRLTAEGFGSEKPVADNKTEAGRSKNRRVELKSSY